MNTLQERFAALPAGGIDPASDVAIREGAIDDYTLLSRFHYRASRPAVVVKVLTAALAHDIVGVLTVSMPPLEGRWREAAWPGAFRSGSKARNAAALNREVRTISRVVIEPRYRGLGIATRLVRAYLAQPLTGKTEALAAMGAYCPFFARAGMKEWILEPSDRDTRLISAVERARLELWQLVRGDAPIPDDLERALRLWADGSRTTRNLKDAARKDLASLAAMAVGCRPVAYTSDAVTAARSQAAPRALPS